MTTHSVADRSGFVHELLLHTSTAEIVEFVVAFARDGVAAAEPTLLAVRPTSPQLSATPLSQHRTSRSCPQWTTRTPSVGPAGHRRPARRLHGDSTEGARS